MSDHNAVVKNKYLKDNLYNTQCFKPYVEAVYTLYEETRNQAAFIRRACFLLLGRIWRETGRPPKRDSRPNRRRRFSPSLSSLHIMCTCSNIRASPTILEMILMPWDDPYSMGRSLYLGMIHFSIICSEAHYRAQGIS